MLAGCQNYDGEWGTGGDDKEGISLTDFDGDVSMRIARVSVQGPETLRQFYERLRSMEGHSAEWIGGMMTRLLDALDDQPDVGDLFAVTSHSTLNLVRRDTVDERSFLSVTAIPPHYQIVVPSIAESDSIINEIDASTVADIIVRAMNRTRVDEEC